MNLDILNKEIETFVSVFLKKDIDIIEESTNFSLRNNLHIPKENYLLLMNFLNITLNDFTLIDRDFMSNTLKKIHTDIVTTQTIHKTLSLYKNSVKDLFHTKFTSHSKILNSLEKELEYIRSRAAKTTLVTKYTSDLENFKKFYLYIFSQYINKQINILLKKILVILNTKIYYLDKLLWIEANNSIAISHYFKTLKKSNKLNTKDYILYTTAPMMPSTNKYKYLQSCLRIYK